MKDQIGERISCLVDGELDGLDHHESLKSLVSDKEGRQRWEHYHLISDVLKRKLPGIIDCQLASRVMAELENEPTVLAPPLHTTSSFGKRMAGLAVAASVAAVAVLGVQFMYKEDGMTTSQQIAQTATPKLPINKEFATRDIQTVTQTLNQSASPVQIIKQYHPDLNKYLLDHNQRSARVVVQGVMPYARIVAHPDVSHIARQSQSQDQNQSQIQR